LAAERIRTVAGINSVLSQVVSEKQRREEDEVTRLRAAANAKEHEAFRLKQEGAKLEHLKVQTGKLLHGDARELLNRLPTGVRLLLTDPPYGMDFQSNRRVVSEKRPKIANDDKDEALVLLADILGKAHSQMADDAHCLIFTGWRWEPEFRRNIEAAGFTIRGSLIWVKNNHGSGDLAGSFAPKHERIIHAVKGNPKLQRRAPDVLTGSDPATTDHPMEKPRDLLRQLIEATTAPGDIVVDPFAGCGNTLLEAYALGRDFFGVELEERWHRVAVDAIYRMAEEEFADGLAGR
jgi:site-specific DNA-methyltransferase (adenine-specific)